MRMTFLKVAMGLAVASCAFVSTAANADIFAKVDGIDGDATANGYDKQIVVQAMQFGVHHASNIGATGGAGAGKAAFTDLTINKMTDVSSPKLMLASMTGAPIKTVVLVVTRASGGPSSKPTEVVKVTLTDVVVSSYQLSSGGDRPSESVSLNFAKIQFEYKTQGPSGAPGGPPSVGWDLRTNQKI